MTKRFILASILCLTVTLGVAWGVEEYYQETDRDIITGGMKYSKDSLPMPIKIQLQHIAEEQKQTKILEDIYEFMQKGGK